MGQSAVVFVALLGAAVASGVVFFVSPEPAIVVPTVLFFVLLVIAMTAKGMAWLPVGKRLLLILFALRPLLDSGHSGEINSASSRGLPLQALYAVVFAAVLIFEWRKSSRIRDAWQAPNRSLVVLLGCTVLAWVVGGLGHGTDAFVRTSWGLLVALSLGCLFSTKREINVFIRVIFYSSVLVLFVLAFNLDQGGYLEGVWRLGGQYGVPNALGAVAFALFAYGLYVWDNAESSIERLVTLSILGLLAVVMTATQSRTVGGLMVIAVAIWLWMRGYRRLLITTAICLAIIFTSTVAANWRLTKDVSSKDSQFDITEVGLTGRTLLWGETLQYYLEADTVHKVIGVGWGAMFDNFSVSKLAEVSSVTENSFLFFLVGSGVIGLSCFSIYIGWMCVKTWNGCRKPLGEFEGRLALLALIMSLTFIIEGMTFDLVLSPIASGYCYAILSLFAANRARVLPRTTPELEASPVG